MKLTIYETQNGCVVVEGGSELDYAKPATDFSSRWSSFNSIDAAIAHVRRVLKRWREKKQAAEKGAK